MAGSSLDNITPELQRLWGTDPLSPDVSILSYSHSPVHSAILKKDHAALSAILETLPKPAPAGSVETEEQSVKAEDDAEIASAMIDRRDVPGKESPLHLAVRMKDHVALEMLMLAGADISLQNFGGWTALQEAVCAGEPALAAIIMREYQTLAWAKWLRRLPRLVATMKRMRDFYMELTWNFESSVIPFIAKIAPSDTYRIWKRGASLRADMSLEGFDGFRIKRASQSVLFLGEGSPDGRVKPGGVVFLLHKEKEAGDALEGMGGPPSDADVAADVADIFRTNVHRAGLDVTSAKLFPVKTWRRQEKEEPVGPWQSKVIDMHHVTVSFRSRKVPGAMSDEELFALRPEDDDVTSDNDDALAGVLTEEERKQLREAVENASANAADFETEPNEAEGDESDRPLTPEESREGAGVARSEAGVKSGADDESARLLTPDVGKVTSNTDALTQDGPDSEKGTGSWTRVSTSETEGSSLDKQSPKPAKKGWFGWGKKKQSNSTSLSETDSDVTTRSGEDSTQYQRTHEKGGRGSEKKGAGEMEFSKGLKPTLWLTEDFPLKVEELLPLLDLLSPRVKAVRRLRELLTVKMPRGTFPVKVAIPIVPTIRVVVTVSNFREIPRLHSPGTGEEEDDQFKDAQSDIPRQGWMDWVRGKGGEENGESGSGEGSAEAEDAFAIPADYTWISGGEKRKRDREKKQKKSTKGRGKVEGSEQKA